MLNSQHLEELHPTNSVCDPRIRIARLTILSCSGKLEYPFMMPVPMEP
jgi:hypothetical protein